MKWSLSLVLTVGIIIGLAVGLTFTAVSTVGEDVKVALWMDVVHRICTSVGGLGTAVALIFVVRQFHLLRLQGELVQKNIRASMDSQLYARLDSFNKFIVEHDREYASLTQPFSQDEATANNAKLHHLCDLGFTFYEEIYKHHVRYGLLETEDWEEWQQNMSHFFEKSYVQGYWKSVVGRYARSFQAFANHLVSQMQPRPAK
ncbi:hypothetical protein AYO44_11170 [Planctomycetaceae bacterium SCGC AG-212-F19]|nr:hypothetical protein AYO44_11170 [Planctomycetaceae bacterium SCGC AG-212-F19]